jgi:hypothetical protein
VPAQACATLGLVFEWQTNCNLLDTVFTNKTGNVHIRHISGFFVQKCCRGKEISVTYYECVCSLKYPARDAHGHIVICVACPALQYSPTLSHKRHHFIKTFIKHKMCDLSLQLCPKHFYSEKKRARCDQQ